MQVAWYQENSWIEARNVEINHIEADGELIEAFFRTHRYSLFRIPSSTSSIQIGSESLHLDASLSIDATDSIEAPIEGTIRIQSYEDLHEHLGLYKMIPGSASKSIRSMQREYGWCHVQAQWCVDNRIGPNRYFWIPPHKTNLLQLEAVMEGQQPKLYISHGESIRVAFQWYRQPLLAQQNSEHMQIWIDKFGGEVPLEKAMVGDRFCFWSPQGWKILFMGKEYEQLILERRPAQFSLLWMNRDSLYRSQECPSYNASLWVHRDDLVLRNPRFSSCLFQQSKGLVVDGAIDSLSGQMLRRLHHV